MKASSAIAALLLLFAHSAAHPATITILPSDTPGEAIVTIGGTLVPSDAGQFRTKVSNLSKALVVLQSDGGAVMAGIEIGRMVRMRNFTTWVPSGFRCGSACALAWLGGSPRAMGARALIGFHAAYDGETGRESGFANAVVGGYLSQLGLSDLAIVYITGAGPTSMTWLSVGNAAKFGIEVASFDPKPSAQTSQAQPSPPLPQQSTSLQDRAKNFVVALYATVSRGERDVPSIIDGVYADAVQYYGRSLPHDVVIAQISRYLDRWPVRKYTPKSATAECDNATQKCSVVGVVQFDARSDERNKRSFGTATFQYLIDFSQAARPKITVEDGKVLERRLDELSDEISLFPSEKD